MAEGSCRNTIRIGQREDGREQRAEGTWQREDGILQREDCIGQIANDIGHTAEEAGGARDKHHLATTSAKCPLRNGL